MPDQPPLRNRLGFRLALALALALLPLGVLSGYQAQSMMREAQARSEAAILGETLLAVAPEAGMIRGARAAAAAMAVSLSAFYNDPTLCGELLRKLVDQGDISYSYAAFVPLSGQVTCSSTGGPLDLSDSPRLAAMIADPVPDIQVIRAAVVSGTSVLAFGHPVFGPDGSFQGYVSLSIPHTVLRGATHKDWVAHRIGGSEPVAFLTFDSQGEILTSTTGLDNAPLSLPADRTLLDLVSEDPVTFSTPSQAGDRHVYAVAPIVAGTLYTLGSWPADATSDRGVLFLPPYVPPVLMWLASLLVAILAAEQLVTRHIRVLRHSITSFAHGARHVGDMELSGAATEIRDVANAYLKMTDTILHDEAELEDIAHQRETLMREVHHRVKNNLQLIASIMNMQMRQARSPETRALLKSIQDRVMSLATVHRELYQTSGLTEVRADELLAQIVRQILSMASGPGRQFDLVTSFEDLRLTPDQAVPLSLLLTEALTNAIKYSRGKDGAPPRLQITLRRDDEERAVLEIANSIDGIPTPAPATEGSGLGADLLSAFAMQLGGRCETEVTETRYRLWVGFKVLQSADADMGPGSGFPPVPAPEDG